MTILFTRLFIHFPRYVLVYICGLIALLSYQLLLPALLFTLAFLVGYMWLTRLIYVEQQMLVQVLTEQDPANVEANINALLTSKRTHLLSPLTNAIVHWHKQHHRRHDESCKQNLELGYSAQELANNAQAAAQQSHVQHQNCMTTATATTQINVSLSEISLRIEAVRDAAIHSQTNCHTSFKTLTDSKQQVAQVSDVITQTQVSLQQLKQKLDIVISMSKVINDMADQTNLLAINASIEAAKAGEFGRGFSVVANEMKMLAERSQTSAKTITNKTNEVTENMHQVEQQMQVAMSHINQSGVQVESAFNDLNVIVEMTKTMALDIDGVAVATEQQMCALQDISQAVNNLTTLAAENSHMSSQQASVAKHLSQIAHSI